ncbi:MAG: penicillin-binding protein 1A [Ectothiorhodospiraceae bacterium]|nr:penicillin-binding protein 1A [Chromatiales bacterium]MCP5156467.1 penicillin-binding protein 1A [Ectothiorhodospiraceae bacterium]
MARLSSFLRAVFLLLLLGGLLGVVGVAGVWWYFEPKLPSVDSLRDAQLQVPLRIFTRDGKLLGEFGEKRRVPMSIAEVPDQLVQAVLAAEDERFYQHPGVDWQGITRAVVHLVRTGEKGPGGSTITMQVARNFFLGREKTYLRKLNEILLAFKIERELTKDEILELYLNKIFLGHRAYGVGAAAQVYYGRDLVDLDLPQVAMIAGLPKAPSRFNPVVNPERAIARRNYVLGRMLELGFITAAAHDAAVAAPVTARVHAPVVEVEAPYVAEMVRASVEERYGEDAYNLGLRVTTTIDSRLQEAANRALRGALLDYDQRHGYRGPELTLDPASGEPEQLLADVAVVGGLAPALVLEVGSRNAIAHVKGRGRVQVDWAGLEWARRHIDEDRLGPAPKKAADVLAVGDVVRLVEGEKGWRLAEVPAVEGALVSLEPDDGGIVALTGGFDFFRSKFNRAIQAQRQPGSSFKPFVYSAALERGYTAASFINDAPIVHKDPGLEDTWRPENYSGKFFGPTRLREALFKSRNLVSIRLLQAVGIQFTMEHLRRFGLDADRLPPNLSLALGSGAVTPLELASGYAVFANGGYRVEPYFIDTIEDADGRVVYRATPLTVCPRCPAASADAAPAPLQPVKVAALEGSGPRGMVDAAAPPRAAPRTLPAENAWIMTSMMKDVVRRGTATRARKLGRDDIAGKTGTTNDQHDAWFSGFSPHLVATAWVGFDQLAPLGRRETGGAAALPAWIDFMAEALRGLPDEDTPRPPGVVAARIDPDTGQLSAGGGETITEFFTAETAPRPGGAGGGATAARGTVAPATGGVTEKLF